MVTVACWSGERDGEAADPSRCGKMARPKGELIAELAPYLGVTAEADAVTAVADRADTIGAGHVPGSDQDRGRRGCRSRLAAACPQRTSRRGDHPRPAPRLLLPHSPGTPAQLPTVTTPAGACNR